jgi:hypothetical protein
MKTIIRNFLSALRRYKLAIALNVLELSVAFAAFQNWRAANMNPVESIKAE